MYQLKSYIKFLLSATNQHGVHSPFVYNFVTNCLYDKTKHLAYKDLHHYRQILKSSKEVLEITDLGEGSKVLDSNRRMVSAMVNTSSSSIKEAQLLFRIAQYFNLNTILELGTSLGVGTFALALGSKASKITTIEGCPNTANYARLRLNDFDLNSVEVITGSFEDSIPTLKQETFDGIYIDGHHNKAATIQYFEALLSTVHNDSVVIIDDLYWSKGMTEAWEYIKAHKAVTVTVDCFHLGFVFFRKEQEKQHFKIRL